MFKNIFHDRSFKLQIICIGLGIHRSLKTVSFTAKKLQCINSLKKLSDFLSISFKFIKLTSDILISVSSYKMQKL